MDSSKSPDENPATDLFGRFFKKPEEEKPKASHQLLSPSPYADNYKMNHSKRGMAVIFNHVIFSLPECPRRDGSDRDRDDLVDVFRDLLGFDVLVYDDLTASEILSVLITVSTIDHANSDCLVVVVMSHGENGKLFARDRQYPTKTLWSNFSARRCPSLAGKPKLFFIQACRGTNLHPSQTLHYSTTEKDSDIEPDATYSIPIMADILVMYSTVEGFYSWRDPKTGGYFIQSLAKQLRIHHNNKDLVTILTFVNREVAVDFTSVEPNSPRFSGQKQMCSIVSMLTRLIYFSPKDVTES